MKEIIAKLIKKEVKMTKEDIITKIEIPPKIELGDYSFPCFTLAKEKKKSPLAIAKELVEKFRKDGLPKEITNVDEISGYVNFFVNKEILIKQIFEKIKDENFGSENLGKNKKTLIEYSQPNTHKAFHVGHIRGTCIGESVARIMEFQGEKIIRINYSGDTGMHIAKWIWNYKKFHNKEKLRDEESWIANIYTEAIKKLAKNKEYQKEVEEINKKIETKEDKEINKLWKKTREASIKSWDKIYKQLNTHFDKQYFESEVENEGKKLAKELQKKGIAKKDDAIFMDLKEWNLSVWVLLRKDSTVLYSSKDLALAKRKIKDFKEDEYLIIVGDEQKLHFQQLKKTLELMKFEKEKEYNFLTFGMVRFPEGKMSSRTGNNVLYSDFFEQIKSIAHKGLIKRGATKKEAQEKSEKIAIAAIKYSMLKQDFSKTMIFDPKEAVTFEGDTGPYLLYSYARANSITKKVKSKAKIEIIDLKNEEIELLNKINQFKEITTKAYKNKTPNIIANYSFELAKNFNEFYHECPVLGSIEEGFRLKLVEAFKITIKKSLDLLGIETLEEM